MINYVAISYQSLFSNCVITDAIAVESVLTFKIPKELIKMSIGEDNNNTTFIFDKIKAFPQIKNNEYYYFYQTIPNAKDLDSAIIGKENNTYKLLLLQITIGKDEIFNNKKIMNIAKTSIASLKRNHNITISISNCYFAYVIPIEIESKEMIFKCDSEGIGYFFFSINNHSFTDRYHQKLKIPFENILQVNNTQKRLSLYTEDLANQLLHAREGLQKKNKKTKLENNDLLLNYEKQGYYHN